MHVLFLPLLFALCLCGSVAGSRFAFMRRSARRLEASAQEIMPAAAADTMESQELRHFKELNRGIFKDRTLDMLVPGAAVYPQSERAINYVISMAISDCTRDDSYKASYFDSLTAHYAENGELTALIHFLLTVPDQFFSDSCRRGLCGRTPYMIARMDGGILILSKIYHRASTTDQLILPAILSTSISTETLDTHFSGQTYNHRQFDMAILESIITLCTTRHVTFTTEECAILHARNEALIERANRSSTHRPILLSQGCAALLNAIRFSPANSFPETHKMAIVGFLQQFTDQIKGQKGCELLLAALYAHKLDFFRWVLLHYRPSSETTKLREAIKENTSFVNLLTLDEYRRIMGVEVSALDEARFNRASGATIDEIEPVAMRLAVVAEMGGLASLTEAVASVAIEEHHSAIVSTLTRNFPNPVPLVNVVMSRIDELGVGYEFEIELGMCLGSDKLLQAALLGPEGDSLLIPKGVKIRAEAQFIRALLDQPPLAEAFKSERGRHIRERLSIGYTLTYGLEGLNGQDILDLFAILQLPIPRSFSDPISHEQRVTHRKLFTSGTGSDFASHVNDPGFLCLLIWHLSEGDVKSRYPRSHSHRTGLNPALLAFFDLYELWYNTDRVHFTTYAPSVIVKAFIPSFIAPVSERGGTARERSRSFPSDQTKQTKQTKSPFGGEGSAFTAVVRRRASCKTPIQTTPTDKFTL